MTKAIADAGTLRTKAGKALDRMRARAEKADEAWDVLATQATTHADQCRHGAELADRTRHRWAR